MRSNRLWETLFTGIIAAAAIAIAASCFVHADGLSRTAYAQDVTLGRAQAVCDILSATGGNMLAVADYLDAGLDSDGAVTAWLDGDGVPCGQDDAAYILAFGPALRDGLMGLAEVRVYDMSGREIISITASWQEEAG